MTTQFAQGWAEQRLASTSARNGILNIHSVGEMLNKVYRSRKPSWTWIAVDPGLPIVKVWWRRVK